MEPETEPQNSELASHQFRGNPSLFAAFLHEDLLNKLPALEARCFIIMKDIERLSFFLFTTFFDFKVKVQLKGHISALLVCFYGQKFKAP